MKKVDFEITGICSGDYEASTMDVTKDEYIRLCKKEPDRFNESCFYRDRYRYYGFDIPYTLLKDFVKGDVLHIKATYEIEKVGHETHECL